MYRNEALDTKTPIRLKWCISKLGTVADILFTSNNERPITTPWHQNKRSTQQRDERVLAYFFLFLVELDLFSFAVVLVLDGNKAPSIAIVGLFRMRFCMWTLACWRTAIGVWTPWAINSFIPSCPTVLMSSLCHLRPLPFSRFQRECGRNRSAIQMEFNRRMGTVYGIITSSCVTCW